jgi:putative glutamine amidotransferase
MEAEKLRNLDTTASGRDRAWIAVLGQWRKGCLRLPLPYVDALSRAGAHSKVLSPFELLHGERPPADLEIHAELDPYDGRPLHGASGLMLCGGGDIDPEIYGQKRHPRTHNVSRKRDQFELTYLREALVLDMPVLAICRGMQLLNVGLRGTLNQHLMDDPSKLDHYVDRPLGEPAHGVSFREDSLMPEIFGSKNIQVNTHHHQGLDSVAEQLDEVGWAEDGVLEAVVSRDHDWVVGVQWHPEAMVPGDKIQQRLFEGFVEATLGYSRIEDASVEARSA